MHIHSLGTYFPQSRLFEVLYNFLTIYGYHDYFSKTDSKKKIVTHFSICVSETVPDLFLSYITMKL